MSRARLSGSRVVTIEYHPTYKQQMFHGSTANEALFGGAAGGGKTKCLAMDAVLRCIKYPNSIAACFRRTYKELEDTLIKEVRNSCPIQIATYTQDKHEMKFINGSKILFRHCEYENDKFLYQGMEIDWLYIDELTTFTLDIYDYLKTRLRSPKKSGIVPIVRCASNPGNIGNGWVKQLFVDSGPYISMCKQNIYSAALKEWREVSTQYIPCLATENPYITKDYIFQLEQKPEALRRALLNGDWDAFDGQVFTEFKNDPAHYKDHRLTHVIEPFEIPESWPRYMSFDHGYSRPFSVGWWAIGPRGEAYRYKEWYGCVPNRANTGIMLSPQQIAEGIVAREVEEYRDNITIDRIADPAIFEHSRGDSIARLMEPRNGRPGVYFRPGDNHRMPGKMALHQRLRFDGAGFPMIYIFNTCTDWIRTIPNLPYSLTKFEDVNSDAEDHAYDETRYFLMSQPMPGVETEKEQKRIFNPYNREGDYSYENRIWSA